MQNDSYENDFDLHENGTVCRTHFHMKGFALTRFEREAQENSEIAYSFSFGNVFLLASKSF